MERNSQLWSWPEVCFDVGSSFNLNIWGGFRKRRHRHTKIWHNKRCSVPHITEDEMSPCIQGCFFYLYSKMWVRGSWINEVRSLLFFKYKFVHTVSTQTLLANGRWRLLLGECGVFSRGPVAVPHSSLCSFTSDWFKYKCQATMASWNVWKLFFFPGLLWILQPWASSMSE